MTKQRKNKTPPSLLDPEARGGDTAEGGFSFQESIVLSKIPGWLSYEGFTSMVREAMGDTEAKFFVPGSGPILEFIEVKNHVLTPAEFWEEIKRFRQMQSASGQYRWFTLVSAGFPKSLSPLAHGLRRIRDPHEFYGNGSSIADNSFKDYVSIVKKLNHTERDAHFLFDRVLLEIGSDSALVHAEALFTQELIRSLPGYKDLPAKVLQDMFIAVGNLVRSHKNQPITRLELESCLRNEQLPPSHSVRLHTAIGTDTGDSKSLRFGWESFFGGNSRSYPSSNEWDQKLIGELQETKNWVLKNRSSRRIRLTGNRRLSASLAFGAAFSAVGGFSIEMVGRGGEIWATDAYPTQETPPYSLTTEVSGDVGERLIVGVSMPRDIRPEVEAFAKVSRLGGEPAIYFHGEQPILSPEQVNVATKSIKDAISLMLQRTGCKQIDLFFSGPAQVALFLGHRLNATAPVQCYEWTSTANYVPTCRLG